MSQPVMQIKVFKVNDYVKAEYFEKAINEFLKDLQLRKVINQATMLDSIVYIMYQDEIDAEED